MKVRSEGRRVASYRGCDCMPTDSTSVSVLNSCYERLKEDIRSFSEKGKVVVLGDFNARVGRYVHIDDVIGIFWEDTYNASGKIFFLF